MIGITQSVLGFGIFAIDQIAKIGLSSLQVIYYFEKLFRCQKIQFGTGGKKSYRKVWRINAVILVMYKNYPDMLLSN